MKTIYNFIFKFLFVIFGVLMICFFISCQNVSSERIDNNATISNENIKVTQIEDDSGKINNSDEECLKADFPKLKKRISVGVLNSKAIDIPKPEYPDEVKSKKIGGKVVARIFVDETGKVIWARLDSGDPLLQELVKKVVCKATFTPATVSGHPYSVSGIITYNFVLP